MDTSDEYAKMCEKAEEIQKTWLLRDGDILYSKKFKTWWIWLSTDDSINPSVETAIWLPRQDQLQEMVGDYQENLRKVYNILIEMGTDTKFWGYRSFEQMWLAIVMFEKYNKVWVLNNWINKNQEQTNRAFARS